MKVGDISRKIFLRASSEDYMMPVLPVIQEKGFGKALVFDDGEFTGVVSKETFLDNRGLMKEKPLSELKVKDFVDENVSMIDSESNAFKGVDMLLTTSMRVDTVVVEKDGLVCGYLTSKEYTSHCNEKLGGRFKVKDLMHYNPDFVYDYTPLEDVIRKATDHMAKYLVVLRGKEVVGVITVKDLMLTLFHHHSREESPYGLTAEEVMSKPAITISEKADCVEAGNLMMEKSIGSLPITDEVEGVKGVISRRDLLKGFEILKQESVDFKL